VVQKYLANNHGGTETRRLETQKQYLLFSHIINPPNSGCQSGLERVLVACDFSDYAELALNYGLSIAQENQAELHLLHVLPPRSVSDPEIAWYPVQGESAYHTAARRLEKAVPPEVHLWCNVTTAVSEGHAYREILDYSEQNEIDLISVGAHGAGFGMRALFGSNVDRVLRQARCPVLVARPLKLALTQASTSASRARSLETMATPATLSYQT